MPAMYNAIEFLALLIYLDQVTKPASLVRHPGIKARHLTLLRVLCLSVKIMYTKYVYSIFFDYCMD